MHALAVALLPFWAHALTLAPLSSVGGPAGFLHRHRDPWAAAVNGKVAARTPWLQEGGAARANAGGRRTDKAREGGRERDERRGIAANIHTVCQVELCVRTCVCFRTEIEHRGREERHGASKQSQSTLPAR
jgi:hypothetical protein